MGARKKLNGAYLTGSLVLAGFVGLASGSWLVFGIGLALIVGAGRHKGRLGAALVEMANGTRFAVGSGFTDAQRSNPPSIGSTITFRFQELTEAGVPRFPTFVRVRGDLAQTGEPTLSNKNTRRFEFVDGSSDKFWQLSVQGSQVTVCFGRNGTAGQRETKTFADAATAKKHADKKIAEKLKKGYREVNQAA